LAAHEGNFSEARRWVEDSRARNRDLGLGDDWTITLLDSAARHAAAHGQPERALRLAAATRAQREVFHLPLFLQDALERTIAPSCRTLRDDQRTAALRQGQRMTLQEAVADVLDKSQTLQQPQAS